MEKVDLSQRGLGLSVIHTPKLMFKLWNYVLIYGQSAAHHSASSFKLFSVVEKFHEEIK